MVSLLIKMDIKDVVGRMKAGLPWLKTGVVAVS
jgi:hypothetical protein